MFYNQAIINTKYPQQIKYQQQRNYYRSCEKANYSPNAYNNINITKNQNNNIKTKKITKNNGNIYYFEPKNNQNQVNLSQNIAILKKIKDNQNNQIYLEGDLDNFINGKEQHNKYPSNLNKQKKNINNFFDNKNNYININRVSNVDRPKKNRGLPKKSPIPIPKGFSSGKYLNNDNMSKYSTDSNNQSYQTAYSQLLNNNYSISNLSQVSGFSNNSYNNPINYQGIINNENIRSYSNNNNPSIVKKRLNGSNSYNNKNILNININKNNTTQNRSSNNILNKKNNISLNNYKIKTNNYFNNNDFINVESKNPKFLNKSPNPQDNYLSNTIKRNNNKLNKGNNYNMLNNSNITNINNISNINNESLFNSIAYRTSNFGSTYNNNIKLYENYDNFNNQNNIINYNERPLTSHSLIKKRKKVNNLNNNMIMNQLGLNNNININDYHSNDNIKRQNLIYNNKNKINNNKFIHEYNTNASKRDYSANIPNNRINLDKINNEYNNDFNSINPNSMVNLHIINKGQIINNNYNNINNINNNMNNLYVYKYNISQNNIIPGKYKSSIKENNNKQKDPINNINNMNSFYNNGELNLNYNNINVNYNRQNNNKYNKKGKKIRSNSSSEVGMNGELNILGSGNSEKNNQIPTNQKTNNINKNNFLNNNKPQKLISNINNSNLQSQNKSQIIKHILKIHHFTHVGFNGEKDKDFNQDIAFLEKNFAGNNLFLYLSVCDGHGVEGHKVSSFIKAILPKELSNSLYQKDILTNDKFSKKKIYNLIGETFIKVNEKLISNESINSIFSGTTCVSVIYTPIKLICANIGDSRAVLGRFDNNLKSWISINLSRDHKPTEEDEARRILKKGGRIKPFIDEETGEEVGPQRVWVKDDEVPGLAMTRSFGDRVAAIAGTICIPEIKEYIFDENDKFMILASDGVWEFIQSDECIDIIGKFYLNNNIEGCCEFLYRESRKRWIKEEEVVDDITMLIIFFD